MDGAEKLKILQANLESVVADLERKNKEAEASQRDLVQQRELVGQITKKLDGLAKRNKQLEKENARFVQARDEMVCQDVQTEPDAQLVAAEAARDAALAAAAEAEAAAAAAKSTAAKQVEEESTKAHAAAQGGLQAAQAAVSAAEAKASASEAALAVEVEKVAEAEKAAEARET